MINYETVNQIQINQTTLNQKSESNQLNQISVLLVMIEITIEKRSETDNFEIIHENLILSNRNEAKQNITQPRLAKTSTNAINRKLPVIAWKGSWSDVSKFVLTHKKSISTPPKVILNQFKSLIAIIRLILTDFMVNFSSRRKFERVSEYSGKSTLQRKKSTLNLTFRGTKRLSIELSSKTFLESQEKVHRINQVAINPQYNQFSCEKMINGDQKLINGDQFAEIHTKSIMERFTRSNRYVSGRRTDVNTQNVSKNFLSA